jgi:uncharacterized protein YdaU (DUF1376 family)
MKPEEVGVYLLLLCEQHQNGRVTWPCERKAAALQTHPDCIEYVLGQCFKKDRHGFYSPRLRQIHAEQQSKSEQGKRAAQARWDKGSDADASPEHMPDHMPEPMPNDGNQNQNQNQNQNTHPSLSAREVGLAPDEVPATEQQFYAFWEIGGKGPLLPAEQEYRQHVPSRISAKEISKAFTAYKAQLDDAFEMNTSNWIRRESYRDTTLFEVKKSKTSARDSYFDGAAK